MSKVKSEKNEEGNVPQSPETSLRKAIFPALLMEGKPIERMGSTLAKSSLSVPAPLGSQR